MQNIVNDFLFYGDSNITMLGELWGRGKEEVVFCCILSMDMLLWSSTSCKNLCVKEDFFNYHFLDAPGFSSLCLKCWTYAWFQINSKAHQSIDLWLFSVLHWHGHQEWFLLILMFPPVLTLDVCKIPAILGRLSTKKDNWKSLL